MLHLRLESLQRELHYRWARVFFFSLWRFFFSWKSAYFRNLWFRQMIPFFQIIVLEESKATALWIMKDTRDGLISHRSRMQHGHLITHTLGYKALPCLTRAYFHCFEMLDDLQFRVKWRAQNTKFKNRQGRKDTYRSTRYSASLHSWELPSSWIWNGRNSLSDIHNFKHYLFWKPVTQRQREVICLLVHSSKGYSGL